MLIHTSLSKNGLGTFKHVALSLSEISKLLWFVWLGFGGVVFLFVFGFCVVFLLLSLPFFFLSFFFLLTLASKLCQSYIPSLFSWKQF